MGRREEKKKQTLLNIREAAWRLFILNGYDRSTIDDIASEAGIARGTYYLYFPDKLTCFCALLEDLYQPIIDILKATLEDLLLDHDDPLSHQIRYIRTAVDMARFLESQHHRLHLHYREIWSAGEHGESIRKWRQQIEGLSQNLIEASITYKLISVVPPKLTSLAVVGSAERLVWAWLNDELPDSRRQIAQNLALLFWKGIAPQPQVP